MNTKSIEILQIGPHGVASSTEELEHCFTVHRWWEQKDEAAFLREIGPRIRGIAGRPYPWKQTPEFLAHFPKLEITTVFGAGYDSVDMPTALTRGIMVTNTPGAAAAETADGAMALLLAVTRELRQADRFIREGLWPKGRYPLTPSLHGRTVGILGLGRIGKAIAKRCEGFDLKVVYHGRGKQDVSYAYYPSLMEMARDVDVLMIAAPGSSETQNIVNADVLEALGPNGILVNVGRGTIVDEPALIAALQKNVILAAGLDVTANEPNVSPALLALDNAFVLPHLAGASTASWKVMADMQNDDLKSWFAGKGALHPVPEMARRAHKS
jgi:lactate dehydrogenase-like 2-hydroxyacid dehydrogenase